MPMLIQTVRIDGKVNWRCFRAKSGSWIGICDPLRLTIEADSWFDLMEDIGQGLDALMRELLATNELDRFLREQGWNLIGPMPAPAENLRFDLPFIPSMMGAHGSQTNLHQ